MALTAQQQSFVDLLMPHAIAASQRTGVDPRIIIAQAAQETGWGRHAPNNNYFGIKSHGQGGGASLGTFEYENGQPVTQQASFRQYGSPAESVEGYADFLLQNPRYRPMMAAQGIDAQVAALGASGYATDPNYAASVGSIARSIPSPGGTASVPYAPTPQSSRNMSKDYTPSGKPAGVANVANAANATAQAPAMNFPILDRIRARLGDRPTPFLDRIQERLTEFRTNRMERRGAETQSPIQQFSPLPDPLAAGGPWEQGATPQYPAAGTGQTAPASPAGAPGGGLAAMAQSPYIQAMTAKAQPQRPPPQQATPTLPPWARGGMAPPQVGGGQVESRSPFPPGFGGPPQGQQQGNNARAQQPAAMTPLMPSQTTGFSQMPQMGPQGPGLSRPNGPSPINLMSILGLTEPQPGVLPQQPRPPSPLLGSMGGQNDKQAGLRRFLAAVLGNG